MSEYELVDLFNSHVQGILAIFMAFISTTSAFLVATYLAGRKFSSFLARVTMSLYVMSSLVLIDISERQATTLIDLREEMRGAASWHPAVYEADWIAPTSAYSLIVLMVSLLISSLWFFAYTRRSE